MSETYAQLAAERLPAIVEEILVGVAALTLRTLPHETKALRKRIAAARDTCDLFAFAYAPPADGRGRDRWRELRKLLNKGYDRLGAFKEVFDRQLAEPEEARYDEAELAPLREAALAWRDELVARRREILATARLPAGGVYARSSKQLPRGYWAEVALAPAEGHDGLAEFAHLARALLQRSEADLAEVLTLRRLHEPDTHHRFHEARKRLRRNVRLLRYFPALVGGLGEHASGVATLDEAQRRMGAINDLIVRHEHARAAGTHEAAEALRRRVRDDWRKLRGWLVAKDVAGALGGLRRRVRAPGGRISAPAAAPSPGR